MRVPQAFGVAITIANRKYSNCLLFFTAAITHRHNSIHAASAIYVWPKDTWYLYTNIFCNLKVSQYKYVQNRGQTSGEVFDYDA